MHDRVALDLLLRIRHHVLVGLVLVFCLVHVLRVDIIWRLFFVHGLAVLIHFVIESLSVRGNAMGRRCERGKRVARRRKYEERKKVSVRNNFLRRDKFSIC